MIHYLPIAVRGYMAPTPRTPRAPTVPRDDRPCRTPPPGPVLIIDTETTTDITQALTFGAYRYCRQDRHGRLHTVAEGLFHADDLPETDPGGYATLRAYARHRKADTAPQPDAAPSLQLMSRRDFVNKVLWPAAARARGTVVGFNLPFDISRIAIHVGQARGSFNGGFSFQLWDHQGGEHPFRPRIAIRSIDSKRARIAFTRAAPNDDGDLTDKDGTVFRGNFLDLRTLASALTNTSHSLASACSEYGITEGKGTPGEHGHITEDYIDYCRRDVRITACLYEKLTAAHRQHPIDLPATAAYSPASIAKAYLRAMNIQPPLQKHTNLDPDLLGAAMSAFYGGRSECMIRRTPVPVTVVDFTAMYPTVNALMNTWQLLTAERITTDEVTDEIRHLADTVTLADCFNPALWPRLVGIALVEPDGDILPVRARYGANDEWGNAVNPVHQGPLGHALWYSLADVVASTLLTGRPPKILRAVRFEPHGTDPDLLTTTLHNRIPVDPSRQDFFRRVIEERQRLRATGNAADATTAGFLKVLANSGAYGVFAELNRTDQPVKARAQRTVHSTNDSFVCRPESTEEPGGYFFPPLATAVTGAARLMLALLERSVTDLGGAWAFADTDSMAIVSTPNGGNIPCPGGLEELADGTPAVRALHDAAVQTVRARFASLNPYDQEAVPDMLKREHTATCFAISAKRYALYQPTEAGGVDCIVKASEHGLGHLLPPSDDGDQAWIDQAWRWIIEPREHQQSPDWLHRPAVSQTTISSTRSLRPFTGLPTPKTYAEQVKPYNFLAVAYPHSLRLPEHIDRRRFRLAAAYNRRPDEWLRLDWRNPYNASEPSFRLSVSPDLGSAEPNGDIPVRTYRDVLRDYAVHPEGKTLGPGGHVCSRGTIGQLRRRPTGIAIVAHIGKEAHRLDDARAGLISDHHEVTSTVVSGDEQLLKLALAVLKDHPTAVLATSCGVSTRRLHDIRTGKSAPRPQLRRRLLDLAQSRATGHNIDENPRPASHTPPASILAVHLSY